MANVSIKFNGKEFLLSCEDGQEEHLEELLIQINQKFNNLKNDLGNLGENKLLLITAVKVMDEYYETKKKVEQKKDELKNLSNKFKELKSLIYEYKDRKENCKLSCLRTKKRGIRILKVNFLCDSSGVHFLVHKAVFWYILGTKSHELNKL